MIRRAKLFSRSHDKRQVGVKKRTTLPSSEVKTKKEYKFPSTFLKSYILCSILLTLGILFYPLPELDISVANNVEMMNQLDPSAVIKVADDENNAVETAEKLQQQEVQVVNKEEESEFDEEFAKKIVAAGLGKLEILPDDQLEARRQTTAISIVISHCEERVNWIPQYIGDKYKIKDIVVYSKCGKEVKGISTLAKLAPTDVVRLENVGRCDHSYAYWISTHYYKFNKETDGDNIVLFLKDNRRFRKMFRDIDEVFTLATETGFACIKKPECDCYKPCNKGKFEPMMMHQQKYLTSFSLDEYSRIDRDENNNFLSEKYKDLKSWNDAMGFRIPKSETLPVCYLGMFAAKRKQIFNQPSYVWERMTNSLKRANNIIEGHYAERMWAPLLSNQDERYLKEIDKVLLPKVKRMVKRQRNGIICGMLGMYYVKKGETYDNYFN